VLSGDYITTSIELMSAMVVGFYDNAINAGNIINKPAIFNGNSTNDGYATFAVFSPASANGVVTNDGSVDFAEFVYTGGSIANNGTIQYAKFYSSTENAVSNNGTIGVSAYWWGHVWPNPADVTQILVTPVWVFNGLDSINDGSATSVSAIYVSGGYSTIAEVVSASADFWNNPQLANDATHMPNGKAVGYVSEGGMLYYINSTVSPVSGYIFSGLNPNPNGGTEWYIDGVVSNLDNQGNSTFYYDKTNTGANIYNAGTYETWNSKFYQDGVPYTGSMEYAEWATNEYNVNAPTGNTLNINFVNGVAIIYAN